MYQIFIEEKVFNSVMTNEKYQKKLERFLLWQEERKLKQKLKKKKKKKIVKTEDTAKPKKKRRVGRPRKPGPKKKRVRKKIIKPIKSYPVFDFKIITTLNGKQNGYIGQYHTYADAFQKMCKLKEDNQNVIFPRKFLNNGNITIAKEEYLILEKNRYGDKEDGLSRNEYGKYIVQKITNNNKWVVRDKMECVVEETFWVYGFCPKCDRKTFTWIYDNMLLGCLDKPYDIIYILVYKNKVIFRYDTKPLGIIMCKNTSDAIRMYNLLSELSQKNKHKQLYCIGSFNTISDKRRDLENEIFERTGWSKRKIQRSTN